MPTLAELTEKDLIGTETFERIRGFALDCIDHLMAPESRRFADMLEQKITPSFQTANPELYAKYQQLIIGLKFTSLVTLDQKTVYKLMRFHLLDAFRQGIDINDRMTGRMYLLPDTAFEDEKMEIINELKENNQKLGLQQIILKDSSEPVSPLVKYWLADYDRWFGPEKHSGLEQQQYLNTPNPKTLNQEGKNYLIQLLQFYDNLKPIPISTIDKYLGLTEGEQETGSMPVNHPRAETNEPPSSQPPQPTSGPAQMPKSVPPPPSQLPRQDSYKEPIEEEDMSGPLKPPSRPAPRISGNVVDLKDWQNKNQE